MGVQDPPAELLDDICVRFVLTAPAKLLEDFQVMFLVEQAWWYYEDVVRKELPHLRSYVNNQQWIEFGRKLFLSCPELSHLADKVEAMSKALSDYKAVIPVRGIILMDQAMEQVLLVRGFKVGAGWSFPRGKINEGEADMACAVREVLEETGYDCENLVNERHVLERNIRGKNFKLYIVKGLDPSTVTFHPKNNYEIGAYAWHRISELPSHADGPVNSFTSNTGDVHKFYAVQPFILPLRKWVELQRNNKGGNGGATAKSTAVRTQGAVNTLSGSGMSAIAAASNVLSSIASTAKATTGAHGQSACLPSPGGDVKSQAVATNAAAGSTSGAAPGQQVQRLQQQSSKVQQPSASSQQVQTTALPQHNHQRQQQAAAARTSQQPQQQAQLQNKPQVLLECPGQQQKHQQSMMAQLQNDLVQHPAAAAPALALREWTAVPFTFDQAPILQHFTRVV